MKPMCRARNCASCLRLSLPRFCSSTITCPGGGDIDAADEVQDGRLAGPRRSHEGQEIAFLDLEVDAFEDRDLEVVPVVDLLDVSELNQATI